MNLTDLTQYVFVDLSLIKIAADELVTEEEGIQLEAGELLTDTYLDGVAEEVDTIISETGQITVGEIASTHQLDVKIIESALRQRIGRGCQIESAFMRQGKIYTEAFEHQQRVRTRGILRAITAPIGLSGLASKYGLQPGLMYEAADEMCKTGRLAGHVQGHKDRAQYVPDSYGRNQKSAVQSFFRENGWISYSRLKDLDIPDPKKYMKSCFPGCVMLESVCLDSNTLDVINAAIEECGADKGMIDVATMMPATCSDDDTATVLQSATSLGPSKCIILGKTYVVATSCMEQVQAKFSKWLGEEIAKQKVEKEANPAPSAEVSSPSGGKTKGKAPIVAEEEEEGEEGPRGKGSKKKGGKKGKRGGGDSDDDAPPPPTYDSDSDDGGGRGKKSKKGKGKAEKKGKEPKGASKKGDKAPKEDETTVVSTTAMAKCLKAWLPDGEPDILDAMVANLRAGVKAEERKLKETIFVGSAISRRKKQEAYSSLFQETLTTVKLYIAGLEALPASADRALLEKHILREFCAPLATEAVCDAACEEGVALTAETKEGMDTEGRRNLLKGIEGGPAPHLKALEASLSKDLSAFLEASESLAEAVGIYIKALDKKNLRTRIHGESKNAEEELRSSVDIEEVVCASIKVLYGRASKSIVYCSPKMIPTMVAALDKMGETVPRGGMKALHGMNSILSESYMSKASDADEATKAKVAKWYEEGMAKDKESVLKIEKAPPAEDLV